MMRFSDSNDEDIQHLINAGKSNNTEKNTRWALGAFEAWRVYRNTKGENVPDITDMSDKELNAWLSRFVVEARRSDGKDYPPKTLYQICCGLQRHLLENNINKHILRTTNTQYRYFHQALDAKCKDLTRKGVGLVTKKADAISLEDEKLLWKKRIFSDDSAESLLYVIYYYNCKLFGLRGRDEHRSLHTSQFTVGENWVTFNGRNSKTFSGGIKQLHTEPKSITHYDNEEFKISQYYKLYLNSVGQGDFYKRPLPNMMNSLRFSQQVIGINTLSGIIPKICALAGFPFYKP